MAIRGFFMAITHSSQPVSLHDDSVELDPNMQDEDEPLHQTPPPNSRILPDREPMTYLRLHLHGTDVNPVCLKLVTIINGHFIFQNFNSLEQENGIDKYVAYFQQDGNGVYVYKEEDALNYFSSDKEVQLTHCVGRFKSIKDDVEANKNFELFGLVHPTQCLIKTSGTKAPGSIRAAGFVTGDYAAPVYHKILHVPTVASEIEQKTKAPVKETPKAAEPEQKSNPVNDKDAVPVRDSDKPTYIILSDNNKEKKTEMWFKLDKTTIPNEYEQKIVYEFVTTKPVMINGVSVKLRAYLDSTRYNIAVYLDGTDNFYNFNTEERKMNKISDIYTNKGARGIYYSGMINSVKLYAKFAGPQRDLLQEILQTNCEISLQKKQNKQDTSGPSFADANAGPSM